MRKDRQESPRRSIARWERDEALHNAVLSKLDGVTRGDRGRCTLITNGTAILLTLAASGRRTHYSMVSRSGPRADSDLTFSRCAPGRTFGFTPDDDLQRSLLIGDFPS